MNDDDDDLEIFSISGVLKKFCFGLKIKEVINNDIFSEDWNNYVIEIKKEWEGKRFVVYLCIFFD